MSEYCPSCMAENADGASRCSVCGGDMNIQNASHQLPVNTILNGRYVVGKVLGAGGFGITYIGYDLKLDSKVAIKEYYPSGAANRGMSLVVNPTTGVKGNPFELGKSRFLKEAKTLSGFVGDSNIVALRDYFEENGTAYIVMEYLEGEDLSHYAKKHGRFTLDEALNLLEPVMLALDKVHKKGLIHRDISPANIMVMSDGRVKVLDFGSARLQNASGELSLSVMLKPGYAPAEQYSTHGEQGSWTDVYAMSATMYKLITGKTPPASTDRLMEDTLEPPSKLGVKITPEQENALLRGLALKPADRTQTMAELAEDLRGKKKADSSVPAVKPAVDLEKKPVPEKPAELAKPAEKNKKSGKLALTKRGKIVLAAIAAVLVIGITVVLATGAAQYGIGRANESRGNSAEAMKWYTLAAERGFAGAQYKLGVCYHQGNGVEQSYEEAVKWYRLAAEGGNAYAQNNLGWCYQYGNGVEKSYEEAVKWYKLAAEGGNASAQYNLGTCYQYGNGVEQSDDEAAKWYRLAANQGNVKGQNSLGYCYQYGNGVEKSAKEAVKWYRLSAEQGNADGQYNLGRCYQRGLGVERNCEEAVKWYRLAAAQGSADGRYYLGVCYEYGYGVEKNEDEAIKWYKLAANKGHEEAQKRLSGILEARERSIYLERWLQEIIGNRG